MKRDIDKELIAEISLTKEQSEALYAEQAAKRAVLLRKPENQEHLKELRERRAVAEALFAARKDAKLTQMEIAERMNVSQPYIARLEHGKGAISWKVISRYAAACGKKVAITIF